MIRWLLSLLILFPAGHGLAQCIERPGQLGTARTIAVETIGGAEFGTLQYSQTLDLAHKEIVFSFDDGPNPDHTPLILDILDVHCVKATFFLVGRYVDRQPDLVREIARRGHTLASHTYTHPLLHRLSLANALVEIERGQTAIDTALMGTGYHAAPFFRFPGLNHTSALRAKLAQRDIAVMSCDFGADDWRRISADEVYRRSLRNIESRGSGMIIMHDTQARTVEALPRLLETLAERGYTAVHMVAAQ